MKIGQTILLETKKKLSYIICQLDNVKFQYSGSDFWGLVIMSQKFLFTQIPLERFYCKDFHIKVSRGGVVSIAGGVLLARVLQLVVAAGLCMALDYMRVLGRLLAVLLMLVGVHSAADRVTRTAATLKLLTQVNLKTPWRRWYILCMTTI